jgi:hypothetical protein
MFPAETVSTNVQTWLVCGAIWMGFASLLLGFLYLFGRRFELPVGQVATLATVTALPLIAFVHAAALMDLVVAGAAAFHPIISAALLVLFAAICWAACRCLWQFARNENLTRRRKLLAVGVVFLIALVAVPASAPLGVMTGDIETQAWIAPTVWPEARDLHLDAEELQRAMRLEDSRWAWAFIQWQARHGEVVTPLIAVAILMIWHLMRRARRVEGGLRRILRSQKRCELRLSGMCAAGSCIVASLFFLLPYLGMAPAVADMLDARDRIHYERMARPSHAWEEIREMSAKVRSDLERDVTNW